MKRNSSQIKDTSPPHKKQRINGNQSKNASKYPTRGTLRNERICWLDSTVQFFNVISWPKAFYDYQSTQRDAYSLTFNLIKELGADTDEPISENQCNTVAQYFIDYVNYQKSKVPPTANTTPDPLWDIEIEQDAQESIGYFLNMIADLESDTKIPEALTVTPQNIEIIDKMQKFIRDNFAFITGDWVHCGKKNEAHISNSVPQYILGVDLPEHNSSITLQQLIDNYTKPQSVELLNCDHCHTKHVDQKQSKFMQLSDKYMIILVKRFAFDRSTGRRQKKNNAVNNITQPVVVECNNQHTAYKTLAAVNHLGGTVDFGHYSADIATKKGLFNCNDEKIRKISNFDANSCYAILLEKLSGTQSLAAKSNYLHNKDNNLFDSSELKSEHGSKKIQFKKQNISSNKKRKVDQIKRKQNDEFNAIKKRKIMCKTEVHQTQTQKHDKQTKNTTKSLSNIVPKKRKFKVINKSAKIKKRKIMSKTKVYETVSLSAMLLPNDKTKKRRQSKSIDKSPANKKRKKIVIKKPIDQFQRSTKASNFTAKEITKYKNLAIKHNISKQYLKVTLLTMSLFELIAIANQWKINITKRNKTAIIEQIFNHQNNQSWYNAYRKQTLKMNDRKRKRIEISDINDKDQAPPSKKMKVQFEIMSKDNLKKDVPAGITKTFLKKLFRKQKQQNEPISVKQFWSIHNCEKRHISSKHLKKWKEQDLIVTFNGVDFRKQVWNKNPLASALSKLQKLQRKKVVDKYNQGPQAKKRSQKYNKDI